MTDDEQPDESVLLKPKLWPCWLRRIFLLTLPVSFVLWILILGVLFVVACLYVAYIEIRPWFSAMWKNANDR